QGASGAVAKEDEGDPLEARDRIGQARLEPVDVLRAQPSGLVGEIEMGEPARIGESEPALHRLALRTVAATLVLGDLVPGEAGREELAEGPAIAAREGDRVDLAVVGQDHQLVVGGSPAAARSVGGDV